MKKLALLLFTFFASTNLFATADAFDTPINVEPINHFALRWMNNADTSVLWKSADYGDGIYVVEAYFDNCPYCNQNAPLVNQLSADFASQPRVKVLDVSRDCREGEYREWIAKHNPNHPVLNDCNMELLEPLGIWGYPTTVILDCNMNEVWRHVGAWDAAAQQEVRVAINQQLNTTCLNSQN